MKNTELLNRKHRTCDYILEIFDTKQHCIFTIVTHRYRNTFTKSLIVNVHFTQNNVSPGADVFPPLLDHEVKLVR